MVACNGEDAVTWLIAGSIFTTRPFSALATQTAPSAKTIDVAASGVGMRRRTCPLGGVDAHRLRPACDPDRAGSEGDARSGSQCVRPGSAPRTVFTIRPVVPSRRTSPGPSSSVTQAAPPPVAMAPGENGSLVDESTLRDARSTRATRRSSPSSTHAWRASNATSHGWLANGRRATTLCDTASIRPIVFGAIASRGAVGRRHRRRRR